MGGFELKDVLNVTTNLTEKRVDLIMAPPLKSFLANERTYLEWIDMGVSLGGVATALLSLPFGGYGWSLGFFLMPVAIFYVLYAARLFVYRRNLIRVEDLYNPALHSTKESESLGWVLLIFLSGIFILEVFQTGFRV